MKLSAMVFGLGVSKCFSHRLLQGHGRILLTPPVLPVCLPLGFKRNVLLVIPFVSGLFFVL